MEVGGGGGCILKIVIGKRAGGEGVVEVSLHHTFLKFPAPLASGTIGP